LLQKQLALVALKDDVRSKPPAICLHTRLSADCCNRRRADDRDRGVIEDAMPHLHQFHLATKPFSDLTLQLRAPELTFYTRWLADMRRQRLAIALIQPARLIQHHLSEPARRKPRNSALVADTSKRESPIPFQPVPSQKRSLAPNPSHRLDRISNQ